MKVIKNTFISPYDVDDTLVMWNFRRSERSKTILIGDGNFKQRVLPNEDHIRMLKNAKARNHFVIVWSAGGASWAESVVKALGLEKFVDLVITKPQWYTDDVPVQEWLTKRFYVQRNR